MPDQKPEEQMCEDVICNDMSDVAQQPSGEEEEEEQKEREDEEDEKEDEEQREEQQDFEQEGSPASEDEHRVAAAENPAAAVVVGVAIDSDTASQGAEAAKETEEVVAEDLVEEAEPASQDGNTDLAASELSAPVESVQAVEGRDVTEEMVAPGDADDSLVDAADGLAMGQRGLKRCSIAPDEEREDTMSDSSGETGESAASSSKRLRCN